MEKNPLITPLRIIPAFYVAMIINVSKFVAADFVSFWGLFFRIIFFTIVVLGCDFMLYYINNKWLYWVLQILLAVAAIWLAVKMDMLWKYSYRAHN